jgi:DNA-binding CsgD family transcriptional regulator
MSAAQIERAESLVDDALRIARPANAGAAVALALAVESRLLAFKLRYKESLDAALEGIAEPLAKDYSEVLRYQPGIFAIFTLNDMDRFDEMEAMLRVERATAEERGIVWAMPLHHAASANRHYYLGQLADAHAEATAGLTVAEDSGGLLPVAWMHALLALIALHRSNLTAADKHIAAAVESMATTTPLLGTDLVALAQARVAELRRQPEIAAAGLTGAWDLFGAIGVASGRRNIGLVALRFAALTNDSAAVARIAEGLAEMAGATGAAADAAIAMFGAGVAAGDVDQIVGSISVFDPAIQPLARARVGEEAARHLWAAGREEEAASTLDAARRTWADCGAIADAQRAGELFKALGVRRPHTSARPTAGWAALTPTELRIADLVATGAANTAIATELGVSRRTVETHLRHVYAKIGVASRVQLALEASRRDMTSA